MKRLLAIAVLGAALWMAQAQAVTGPVPTSTKRDLAAPAHYDTTFATSAASDQYITWGFAAEKVTIDLLTTSQQVIAQIYGDQRTLLSASGAGTVNPRFGLTRVTGNQLTLPALSSYTWNNGAPVFYGLRVLYTGGACTVIVSADRASAAK